MRVKKKFGTNLWGVVYIEEHIFELVRRSSAEAGHTVIFGLCNLKITWTESSSAHMWAQLTSSAWLTTRFSIASTRPSSLSSYILWIISFNYNSNYIFLLDINCLGQVWASSNRIWCGSCRLEDTVALAWVYRARPFPRPQLDFQSRRNCCFLNSFSVIWRRRASRNWVK